MPDTTPTTRLLQRREVEARIALSRSTIYARLDKSSPRHDPTFPRPITLGNGRNSPVAWIESEVEAWIASRANLRTEASA